MEPATIIGIDPEVYGRSGCGDYARVVENLAERERGGHR